MRRGRQRGHKGATEHRGVNAAAADYRFVPGCGGIVTEVADPDQLVPEAQGKHNRRPTRECGSQCRSVGTLRGNVCACAGGGGIAAAAVFTLELLPHGGGLVLRACPDQAPSPRSTHSWCLPYLRAMPRQRCPVPHARIARWNTWQSTWKLLTVQRQNFSFSS
jgi:hypothetical protein